ncbi:beta-ketoacyl synthase chain length factor [Variovorax sp. OV329]|uniref:beta-ketoacyl synthase chain length factor n=1 Tax=Variovorax sp. OV329 TaxID=1882825 RepID=UPI0008EBA47C|nr:beta-ketoacyl synthase chain length factor [Variovorax sp. OV329]SFM10814.1 Beta-ketoacyl synthase, N-terminal domain [Variovorax sp. OV329]
MTAMPPLYIEGPAFWAPSLPSWKIARAAFRGEGAAADPPAGKPSASLLAPAERRRAPDSVALALEVAAASLAACGRHAADMPCVFTSAHGDLAITDYMCRTLASAPTQISPTKFHNSVHNAAIGYWTIGTGCMQASSLVSGFDHSFATALLEAALQCAAERRPILLVGFDAEAVGPLTQVHVSQGLLAGGVVLAPERTSHSCAAMDWSLRPGPAVAPPPVSDAGRALPPNAMSDLLPVFEGLARLSAGQTALPLDMPLGGQLSLHLVFRPCTTD